MTSGTNLKSNNLINSSSPPPPTLYRKTSIISNLKMKAEKNSNLKKLSGLMKSDNNAVNATENKTGILKTVQKNATIAPKFRSNSIFNPNIKATMEEKRKSSFIEKEKSLVIEDPDLALIDILRVLKKKQYRKAYIICEKFLSSKRSFRLYFEIRYNRMQLVIINKIARLKFIKNQPNHPKFVHKLLNKGILAIKSYCNFLTIFFKKKYPNIPQKMSVDEQICEPYLPNDEELYKIPKKIDKDHKIQLKKNSSRLLISERFLRKATTTNSLEYIFERFDPRSLFDEDYKEDDEYFDKVMERERYKLQKVYDEAETFFFVKNLLELLFNFALIYRNMALYQLSYSYLLCIEEYSVIFETTVNPDLLNTLIKCKLLFGTFLMQFEKYDESLKMLNCTLFLCQKELIIRINMNNYLKTAKRKIRMNYLKCVRTIIMVLFSMCLCYTYQKKYEKMIEALALAMAFSEKFLQRIDVMKKFISRIYSNIRDPVGNFFKDVAEIEKILSDLLVDDIKFQRKMLQKKNNHKISDPLFDTNEKLYDRFEWHKINKSNIIIIPNITKNNVDSKNALRKESKKSHSFRMHKKSHNLDENLFTRASTENNEPIISYQDLQKGKSFLKDDDSNLDLLSQDSSFLYNENPFFSGNLRNKNQILSQDLNIKYFKQNPIDFRPRLLTTGKYFKKFKKNEEIQEIENEIFDYLNEKLKPKQKDLKESKKVEKDLDFHMHNIVEENIEANYPCKNSYQIHEDFTKHLKKEDFDKKEFPFCKKMLLFKKQENCAVESPSNSKKVDSVNRTTTNNAIRKEVNVIEGEVSVKKQNDVLIQNLKKYHTIFLQHDQEDRESSNEGKPEFGSTKLVQLIFKHKEQLNLKKVAKMYHEKMKEKDKFEKKTIEEKLKKQTNLIKKRDFYNFNSIHTLKHFLDNKKILEKTLCNKKISQSTFFLPKSKQSQKKHNISNTNSCVRFGNLNSNRIGSLQSTEQNIENIEEKIEENFEKAQNMIKLLSGDLEKIRQSNDRQLRKSDSSKKTKHESINSNVRLNDLAKSSFYMSLDKQYEKKIFTFAELVKIKAKQHFKGTANFFGSSVFGLSFK